MVGLLVSLVDVQIYLLIDLSAPFLFYSYLSDRVFTDLHDASRLCCVVGDAATGGVCRGDQWRHHLDDQ